MKSLQEIGEIAMETATEKGWYENDVSFPKRIALCHSELSEALEADRLDKRANPEELRKAIKFRGNDEFKEHFRTRIKDTLEDEIADTVIRLCEMAGVMGFNLDFHVAAKLRYNQLREVRHGGKKY